MSVSLAAHIPSPPANGFHLGPLFIHYYGLMYVVGITLAIIITRRRWSEAGGDPALVTDVATWAVPAGIVGGRIYFLITTPFDIRPQTWWGVFAVWNGGLGIWGGIAAGVAVGIWRVHRAKADWRLMCNAVAPALLVAQAIGRIGNYFNQELFGKPTSLPWGLEISALARQNSGMPASYMRFTTFQPSFLYELIFDLLLAGFLVWLGRHKAIRPPGLMALYVTGYSAYRIFEETIRVDSSAYFLGLRLNLFIAIAVTIAGVIWFIVTQRRQPAPGTGLAGVATEEPAAADGTADGGAATADGETGQADAAGGSASDAAGGSVAADGTAGPGPAGPDSPGEPVASQPGAAASEPGGPAAELAAAADGPRETGGSEPGGTGRG